MTSDARTESALPRPLVELGLGVAWMLGLAAVLQIIDNILGPPHLGAAILGAVVADFARGRAQVAWDASADPSWREGARKAAVGAGIALAAGAVVLAVAAALGWVHAHEAPRPSTALGFALVRATAVSVRDEILFRGIPLAAAARARVPAPIARAFAALAGGAALAQLPGAGPAAIALACGSGWLFATLWQRGRGAWAALGAHAAWMMLVGSMLHGGLFDVEWTVGNLMIGATASGAPAWLAALVLAGAGLLLGRLPIRSRERGA